MADTEQNQAPAEPSPAQPPPGHLGDFGYALLAVAWGVVVIAVGMWLQAR
ncbi:MAG: hypothetical protein ABIO70_18010 [Pseudomonadota bacterium]